MRSLITQYIESLNKNINNFSLFFDDKTKPEVLHSEQSVFRFFQLGSTE